MPEAAISFVDLRLDELAVDPQRGGAGDLTYLELSVAPRRDRYLCTDNAWKHYGQCTGPDRAASRCHDEQPAGPALAQEEHWYRIAGESYCIPSIAATIDNLGGLDRGGELPRMINLSQEGKPHQPSLFG